MSNRVYAFFFFSFIKFFPEGTVLSERVSLKCLSLLNEDHINQKNSYFKTFLIFFCVLSGKVLNIYCSDVRSVWNVFFLIYYLCSRL